METTCKEKKKKGFITKGFNLIYVPPPLPSGSYMFSRALFTTTVLPKSTKCFPLMGTIKSIKLLYKSVRTKKADQTKR